MVAVVPRKVIICGLLILLADHVRAGLPVRNQNPFAQFIGLPALQSARLLMPGQQQAEVLASMSSHFVLEKDEADPLHIDGESYMGDLSWRAGFDRWEAAIVIPWVSYRKGFLDKFVVNWHRAFDLPNGNRSSVPDNQLRIAYAGEETFLLDRPAQGVGDIRLQAAYALIEQEDFAQSIYAGLKLPTGNADRGLGSGGADLALFSVWEWRQGHWRQELQAGVLAMQRPEVLPSMRRQLAAFGSLALGYVSARGLGVFVQYDAHSQLYKGTEQPALGDAHMLSAGWRVYYPGFAWSFALTEDIDVDSAPDVGFQLGFRFGDVEP